MDDFVRDQLLKIGFTEDSHNYIYLALKDINEADFRGMTVQKLRHFIPNKPDVQIEILNHVEVLRANALLAENQSNVSSSSGSQSQTNMTGQCSVKPEPVNYSSDSDIEVIESDDENSTATTTVNNKPKSDDDDDSDGSIIVEAVPCRSRRAIKRAHLITLNEASSSTIGPEKVARSEDLNEENSCEMYPSGSGSEGNDLIPRLRVRKNPRVEEEPSNSEPCNESFSNQKKKRAPDNKSYIKAYTIVDDDFIDSLEEILQTKQKVPTKRNYKIDPSLEEDDLSIFYDNLGKYVQCLELEYWSWNHDNSVDISKKLDWWTKDLKKILFVFCPKLEVLTLRTNAAIKSGKTEINERERIRQLPRLRELNITNCSTKVLTQLEIIFKAAKFIQRFQFIFDKIKYVNRVLTLIEKLSQEGFLQGLTELSIVTDGEKKMSLGSKQFQILSRCTLPKMQYLEFGCGLNDVSKDSFEAVLQAFSTSLEVFDCRGTFFGSYSEYFTIVVPKMDKLRYLSIGADYEFDSTHSTDTTRNLVRVNTETGEDQRSKVYDVGEEKDFINFGLQMLHLHPSMETIRIGNKCTLEDLHFFNFPKLETFHVGGPWDRMIKFPPPTSRNPNYPKIETIKIPDCIMNESLILEISRVFPNLTNVTMWLPSAQCLKKFFKTMVNSKLRELHLKTNFCFSWTLTEILIGKERAGTRPPLELTMVEELTKYAELKEFIGFHNIDFPFDTLDPTDPDFEVHEDNADAAKRIEFLNRQLKILEIEHLGRIMEIPKGEFSFKDSRCEFHDQKIGFLTNYPLATRDFINGFNVTRVDEGEDIRKYKIKNISMPRVESQNFHQTGRCRRVSCTCSLDSSTNKAPFGRTSSNFKLSVKPTPGPGVQKPDTVKNESQV